MLQSGLPAAFSSPGWTAPTLSAFPHRRGVCVRDFRWWSVLGHYWKLQAEHSCENTTLKKGTGRTVIKQYVVAIQKLPLGSRTHTCQALLCALPTCAATSSQYFSIESAEGIKRGSSKQRERGHRAHSMNPSRRPEGAAPAFLLLDDPANGHPLAQWRLGCSRVGKTLIKGDQYAGNCLCKAIIEQ